MRSALRRLARHLLISSQTTFRPSFSGFLQRLRSCLLLTTRSSISFSLLPFDLIEASLMVTSPYLLLHSSYRISPNRFSLATTDPRRAFCSSPLRCSSNFLHSSASLAFGHLILFLQSGFFRFLALWLNSVLGGATEFTSWGSSTSLSSSSFLSSCSASATLGPLALWLSTRPWIPFVWPAHTGAVQGCIRVPPPYFFFPMWM